ncbi:MAG: FtsX-like permease family protein [Campylobacteraceae bacterium]|jgi:putative ABC transport system permease protein|nr:FtsX-like permease family protein [Campylobacteraceae bacterium]
MIELMLVDIKKMWLGALAVVLLCAGVVSFGFFITLEERALRESSAKAAERFDLLVGAAGSETQLVLSAVYLHSSPLPLLEGKYYADIANNPLVSWAAPIAFGDYYLDFPIVGTTAVLITNNNQSNLEKGRMFLGGFEAVAGVGTGLLIGQKFTPLHGKVGEFDSHLHEEIKYEVVGIAPRYDNAWDRAVFVPVESVWKTHGLAYKHHEHDEHEHTKHNEHEYEIRADLDEHEEHDEHTAHDEHTNISSVIPPISAVIVKPKSISGAYELRSMYRRGLTQAVFPAEILTKLYTTLGDISGLLAKISLCAQILAIFIIMAASMLYLKLKQRQIALLRAIGASFYRIFLLIWSGFMSLAAVGVAAGAALGFFGAKFVSDKLSLEQGFNIEVLIKLQDFSSIVIFFIALSVILLISCAFSYRYCAADILRKSL